MRTDDPERIGSYGILGRLGCGAMGTVFLGRSPGGRLVAVKVARAELAEDTGFRDRFRREVATMRAVGGFWTAAVVDADPDAPRPWLATEYVPGPNLHDAVTGHGTLPEPALRRLVAGLAEALIAIHAAGLVHRDLKPANVLLAEDGPRVIDFGIARALEQVRLTATGMFVGTPGYLSPEQIDGREVTPASDVFALGCVLVFAATGHGPFRGGDTMALLYRAVHGRPDLDGVPASLRPLASRCLDRDPALRPTPADLLAEVGEPGVDAWLPDRLRTLVAEGVTEIPRGIPRSPTRRYARANGPLMPAPQDDSVDAPAGAGNRAVFRTSRVSAAVWAAVFGVAALLCAAMSQSANQFGDNLPAVLLFVAFVVLLVPTARMLWILLRPGRWVELSADGLTVGRGERRRRLAWSQLARVRVVEDKRRPWLVAWLADTEVSRADLGPAYSGGFRVFPVAHERRPAGRRREVRELRAALSWYGGAVYDPST
ncbi:serine/threonine-protein kinase [Actinophytocola sp.]|uniref:serine/threonine-protein kinase n=1 Tax=Actinophytocola sp. TaxID=1872138 RepID=UPI002D806BF7|nr:serine/threonine-protein kinase [Actinophytocola sp.]HET9143719.1 serine/threonine-protein kinase [Actinophytocola sp.]